MLPNYGFFKFRIGVTVLSKLLNRIYHRRCYLFFCTNSIPFKMENSNKLSLIELTITHFQNDALFRENNRTEKFIRRIKDGHKCYGFLENNENVIAYFWVSYPTRKSPPFTFGLNLKIPSTHMYIWDCRTSPDFQRTGLYRNGLIKIREKYQDKKIFINCDYKNINSIKGIENAGFRLCGCISAYILLSRINLWCKNNSWPEFYSKSIDMSILID